jgi:hypothetical protein
MANDPSPKPPIRRPDGREVAALAATIFAAEIQCRGGMQSIGSGKVQRQMAVLTAIELITDAEEQLQALP